MKSAKIYTNNFFFENCNNLFIVSDKKQATKTIFSINQRREIMKNLGLTLTSLTCFGYSSSKNFRHFADSWFRVENRGKKKKKWAKLLRSYYFASEANFAYMINYGRKIVLIYLASLANKAFSVLFTHYDVIIVHA